MQHAALKGAEGDKGVVDGAFFLKVISPGLEEFAGALNQGCPGVGNALSDSGPIGFDDCGYVEGAPGRGRVGQTRLSAKAA